MTGRLVVVAACCLALGCGPNPPAPVKVMALIPGSTNLLAPTEVSLQTVTNVTNLKGTVASLVGGASVVVDPNDPLQQINGGIANQTDDQRYAGIVKNTGLDVTVNWISKGDVLWPADFDSWNMVTAYYNFERSYQYFLGVYDGVDPVELRNQRVMYWPEVHLNSATPLTDNALYLSYIKSFVLVPAVNFQLVPLAMNLGVIGHEFSHRVFSVKVYGDVGIPAPLVQWTNQPFNTLKSIDEGFADFHGYGVTCLETAGCRPSFLSVSISDADTLQLRDFSRPDACLDPTLKSALTSFSPDQWVRDPSMYKYGDLWAASMYQAANELGKLGEMQKALVASYDDGSSTTPGLQQLITGTLNAPINAFTPENVADVILSHVTDPDLKKQLCSQFLTRLQLACTTGGSTLCAEIPNCPSTASRDATTCPTLP